MKRLLPALLALSLPLLPLTPLSAALNTSIVGADAQWVLHVDLNALRDSELGKELMTHLGDLQAKAANMPIKVDVPKVLATIGTITAYGSNFTKDPSLIDGALVIQGTPDLRKIIEGIVAQATITQPQSVSEIKGLPFEAYSVHGQLIVAFPAEPIILVSKSQSQLLLAHNVFRGAAPSLAKASASPLKSLIRNETGSFFLASSMVPSAEFFPEDAPQARILQMAKSASVTLGENDKMAFAQIQLLASSDEAADKLMKILQGMTALISLTESNDKSLADFLKSVTVNREKNTVSLRLAYASERLVSMIRESQKPIVSVSASDVTVDPDFSPTPPIEDTVILQWIADQNLGSGGVLPKTLVTKSRENATLAPGQIIVLTGHRNGGENARLDYVEFTPANSDSPPVRIEAENMKLDNYTVLKDRYGSGGKLIQSLKASATARFSFAGAAGDYRLTVCYVDENDGKAEYFVSVKAPQTAQP